MTVPAPLRRSSALTLERIRDEYRALQRLQTVTGWYTATQGEASLGALTYLGHEGLFTPAALAVVDAALRKPGLAPQDAMATRFLRRALAGEALGLAVARFDDELSDAEASRFRIDVDDTFYSADYSRAFALAGMMHEGVRKKFGEDWYANKEAGRYLKEQLFAPGTSLSAEDVAARLGFAPKVDFELAARRAASLVAEADALEKR